MPGVYDYTPDQIENYVLVTLRLIRKYTSIYFPFLANNMELRIYGLHNQTYIICLFT